MFSFLKCPSCSCLVSRMFLYLRNHNYKLQSSGIWHGRSNRSNHVMIHQTLADPLFESHFTGELGRQWRTLEKTIDTIQSASRASAHNAAPAIRQIIWRLADWGQPPCEVMTLLTLEGGLGWKCVSLAPCGGALLSEVSLTARTDSERRQLLVPALCGLPEGLFVPGACPFCPADPHKQMPSHRAFS